MKQVPQRPPEMPAGWVETETINRHNSRIVLKWHSPALDYAICLQRKRWFGWKTVAWVYPSVVKNLPFYLIEEYLFGKQRKRMSEKEIGEKILSNNPHEPTNH